MLAKILAGVLTVAAVTTGAGPAHAGSPLVDCGWYAGESDNLPDDQTTFVGLVYGYVVGDPGEQVWVECYVSVDGVPATPIGPMQTNSTVDVHPPTQVTYTVRWDQEVTFCARWYAEHTTASPQDTCFGSTVNSDEVFYLVYEILDGTWWLDPIACGALRAGGTPDAVNLLSPALRMDPDDCDVYVAGEHFLDFYPYQD